MGVLKKCWDTLKERVNIALSFGFACCLAWFLLAVRTVVLQSSFADPLGSHVPFYLCMTGTATIVLVAGAILPSLSGRITSKGKRGLLPSVCIVLATVLLFFASLTDAANLVLMSWVCGFLAGLGFGLLLFQWQSAWVVLDFKSIVLSSVIAWVLCELFFVVVMMFIGVVALICTTLLPLLSYLLLLKSKQLSKPVPPFGQLGVDVGLRVLARLALMGFLFGLINEYMRLSYVQRDFSLAGSAFLTGVYALTLPLVLLVAGITVVWPLLRAKPIQFETPYRVVYMLSAAGVLLLLLPENPPFISYALNMTAFLCLGFIFWAAVIGLCRKHPRSSVRIFGFTQAAWISGPLIIAQTNHELFIRDLLPSAEVVVIAGVFILLMTYCFVFRETDIAATTAEGRSAGFMEKCAQLSWRYHLTNREQEVLVCLAKGRDIAWIQKQLCLSKSTVSTHRQHIYEKIGIHTRQELIDHIEAIE